MKFFGITIGESKKFTPLTTNAQSLLYRDEAPTIRPEIRGLSVPENKKPANIAPVKSTTLSYATLGGQRGTFHESDYDMALINRIEDTDSYVHQAFIKKTGLMFKEGYEFVGADPKTIQYVKLRLAQIARATNIPTQELLRSVGQSLIKKSNAFLVKVRKESASGGKIRTLPGSGKELEPIAGYFIAPAETMKYEADRYGKITKWKQELPDGTYKFFSPDDVVHLYFNKKEGFIFGTPTIIPVIDDIRSLRKIEENIELLIYQHLFPLFHYKVGTDQFPATIDENGNNEIDVAKHEIRLMPSEGGVVTSHRHQIELIGAENRSLRAEGYLEHYKKRVFSGLGISAIDMGEGECYSADTQTLTENGWKFHWQIDHEREKIATFNPHTRKIEFHLANYKFESNYSGKMIHFSNGEELDILVTPHHDMWAQSVIAPVGAWNKVQAKDFLTKPNMRGQLLLTAPVEEQDSFGIIPQDKIEAWSSLVGWLIVGGSLNSDTGNIDITIYDKLIKGEHPLIKAFDELEIPYAFEKGSTFLKRKYKFSFKADVFEGEFKRYLTKDHKSLISAFTELPIAARQLAIQQLMNAGGYSKGTKWIKHYGSARHWWYVSNDDNILDLVQTLCLSAGYLAVIKTGFKHNQPIKYVNIRMMLKKSMISFIERSNVEEVDYNGAIYCYNVPNHLFLTRRNGRVGINGNTANRGTADNMSRNLVDSVKDIQRTVEAQFSEFIINELLLESTYGPDVLNEESRVILKFKEIDLDYQIKKEAHYADQFAKNVISQHEARIGMGRQPMRIPSTEEIESSDNLQDQYPEWYGTFFKLIDEPKALIQAMDEPYSAAAKTLAANNSSNMTSGTLEEASSESLDRDLKIEKEKAKIAKANKPKPVARKRDSFLSKKYEALEFEAIGQINNNTYSFDWLKQLAFITEGEMIKDLKSKTMSAFINGYRSISINSNAQINATIRNRGKIEERVNFYVNRLIRNTLNAIERQNIDSLGKDVRIQKIKAAFEALKYRNDFIENTEIEKAFNLGKLEAAKDNGATKYTLEIDSNSCEMCKNAALKDYSLSEPLDLEDIPPLHPHSRSKIKIL